ncbi:DeoR/GlpR family DNA-binding transcription regulator [Aquamicrobium segne]|uniref:DeoR/GlpR family DNA-binding transcription regulator n=1 Tax=Aquamicrobium segne TaxID=469547 RepID=A0ABW0H0V3_9HYPH
MKPSNRQAEILFCVERDGEVSVPDLVARFEVSAETIRRDLAQLAASGAVQKVHGGARRVRLHVENSFEDRISEQAAEKAIIAQKLRKLVSPGDTCFIDTGTTTLVCAQAIADIEDLTVITNSLHVARLLGAGKGKVFLLGGNYAFDNDETVGPIALVQIAQFRADYAVIGAAALDPEAGPMDANFEEAAIARAMCKHAAKIIIVADSSKYGKRALHHVCPLEDVDIIVSDRLPDKAFQAALDDARVRLV